MILEEPRLPSEVVHSHTGIVGSQTGSKALQLEPFKQLSLLQLLLPDCVGVRVRHWTCPTPEIASLLLTSATAPSFVYVSSPVSVALCAEV